MASRPPTRGIKPVQAGLFLGLLSLSITLSVVAPETLGLGVASIAVLVALALVARGTRIRGDIFSPACVFAGAYVVYGALGLVPLPGYVESFNAQVPSSLIVLYLVGLAATLAGIVCASWQAGGFRTHRAFPSLSVSTLSGQRTKLIAALLTAIAIVTVASASYAQGSLPLLASDVEQARFAARPLAGLGPFLWAPLVGALLAVTILLRDPRKQFWGVLAIFNAFLLLLLGGRTQLFYLAVGLFVLLNFRRRQLRARFVVPAAGILVLMALTFATWRFYQSADVPTALAAIGSRFGWDFSRISVATVPQIVFALVYSQARHTVDTFALWVQGINSYGYFGGNLTIADWSTALPGRRPDSGALTMDLLARQGFPVTTPQPPGVVGSFYGEGGVVGVIAGLGILAWTLQMAYERVAIAATEGRVLMYGLLLGFAILSLYGMGLPGPALVTPLLMTAASVSFAKKSRNRTDLVVLGLAFVAGALILLKFVSGFPNA